eukprot:TRINITY_DN3328_c0_g1_i1.p1 TRINITY_DN3328_c0_g1~~TRINITY_DN3328_c0_g1_i1.p1  ORF type:complete len:426 (+),score=53.08 TRINITY_DN3328_c0_g1_i1:107-1279(+)
MQELFYAGQSTQGAVSPEELLKYIEQQKNENNQSPELQDLLRKVKGENDGETEEIVPQPGFVVKSSDENGRKVFINVCGSDRVAGPGGWQDGKIPDEVQQALSKSSEELSQAQQELLRFPLSLGQRYHDLDNKGVPCIVYDVVFNTEIIAQCAAVRKLKNFVVELAIGWIQHKQQCQLDPQYKLPKMKYKGDMIRSQRIRADKKQLVTDMGDVIEEPEFPLVTKSIPAKKSTTTTPPKIVEVKSTKQSCYRQLQQEQRQQTVTGISNEKQQLSPHQLQVQVEYVGRPVECVQVKVSGFNYRVEKEKISKCLVRGFTVRLKMQDCSMVEQTVLFPIDDSNSWIDVDIQNNLVIVNLKVKSVDLYVFQVEENQPHKFGELGLQSGSYMELDL